MKQIKGKVKANKTYYQFIAESYTRVTGIEVY